jgi:hypothetical protein
MNLAGMNVIEVAPYLGAVVIGVMLVGWLLALFLRVFFTILGPKFTGEGCLTSLATVFAAIIAGACSIAGAFIASGVIPWGEILGISNRSRLAPRVAGLAPPPVVIILLAILLFVVTFLVIRRTLRKPVT